MAASEWILIAGVIALSLVIAVLPKSPDFTRNVSLVGVVLTGVATSAVSYWQMKQRRRTILGARESLGMEDLFARHYADSGLDKPVVVRLWNDGAAKLKIEPEKLRPTDRFQHELAASDFWASLDDPREDLARYAMALAKKHGATIDLKSTKTLDELIRQLATVEVQRPAP